MDNSKAEVEVINIRFNSSVKQLTHESEILKCIFLSILFLLVLFLVPGDL
ncbi:hypothetical protein [Pelosinus propionicus]|nr:hypothetical protein [Pelosinus propionicus]